jgi:hypothetical protein
MKIFGTCIGGSVAIIRDDGGLFLTFNNTIADGDMGQEDLMKAAEFAVPVDLFGKNLSSNMGRAINGAIGQLIAKAGKPQAKVLPKVWPFDAHAKKETE